MRMRFLFTLFRSLLISSEIAKEIMKLRTIEDLLDKIQPACKNEKDIKLMKNYLSYFSSFIAGFSSSEDGQKILLVIYQGKLTSFIEIKRPLRVDFVHFRYNHALNRKINSLTGNTCLE